MSSVAPSIFGRIVTGADLEQAIMASLKKWSSTYLSELERQHGMEAGELARVRSWTIAPTLDKFPEDQLPALILWSVGLAPPPDRKAGSVYSARWDMRLGLVCGATTPTRSHELAELYVAAHRALLLNRQSLDGFGANGTEWLDESYDDLPYDEARSLGWGVAQFSVQVDDVQTVYAGPLEPDAPLTPDTAPWPDDPAANTVDVEVDKVAALNGAARREEHDAPRS